MWRNKRGRKFKPHFVFLTRSIHERNFEEIEELQFGNWTESLGFLTSWICVISLSRFFFKLAKLFVNKLFSDKKHPFQAMFFHLVKFLFKPPSPRFPFDFQLMNIGL